MRIGSFFGLSFLIFVLMLVITPVGAIAPSQTSTDYISKFPKEKSLPDPNQIFDLVNQARVDNGLKPLQKSNLLTTVAAQRGIDMKNNSYYAHRGSDGRYFDSFLSNTEFANSYACENLDLQFTLRPNQYLEDWLGSNAGHRSCLLNKEVSTAGYAVVEVAPQAGEDLNAYIVIAIHATE